MVSVISNLQPLPKQAFSISLDGVFWQISIIEAGGIMAASFTSGGAPLDICDNQRCVAGQLIIPKNREALTPGAGNFMFLTANGDLPWWEEFGITQTFVYATAAELAAIRNGN